MPIPNNPAVARVVLRFLRDERILENVIHVVKAAGGVLGLSDLTAFATGVYDWWHDFGQTWTGTYQTLQDITATKLDPTDPLQFTRLVGEAGTNAVGTEGPASMTAAISARTGKAGRKYRGRLYFPDVHLQDRNANDTLTSTALVSLVNLVGQLDWHLTLTTPAGQRVIFHRGDNLFTPITTETSDNNLDSQRRRLPGRGR